MSNQLQPGVFVQLKTGLMNTSKVIFVEPSDTLNKQNQICAVLVFEGGTRIHTTDSYDDVCKTLIASKATSGVRI